MNKKGRLSACSIDQKLRRSPKEERFKGNRRNSKFLSKESNHAPKFGKNTYKMKKRQLSWQTRRLSRLSMRSLARKEGKLKLNINRHSQAKKIKKKPKYLKQKDPLRQSHR
jgi:hypothetical protein